MRTVTSADGTPIAYDQTGEGDGPVVVIINGAMSTAADGRVTLVQLTQAGRDLQKPVEEIWRALEARWAHLDPADAEQLTSLARTMRAQAD